MPAAPLTLRTGDAATAMWNSWPEVEQPHQARYFIKWDIVWGPCLLGAKIEKDFLL